MAHDLTRAERDAAAARLRALAGHDVRFAHVLDAADLAPHLQATLGQLDRSMDFVAQPLCEIVAEAMRPALAARGSTQRH